MMSGESDVLSSEDIKVFTEVVCEELREAEQKEIEDYKWKAMYDPALPRPRTITDVVEELNREYAKG